MRISLCLVHAAIPEISIKLYTTVHQTRELSVKLILEMDGVDMQSLVGQMNLNSLRYRLIYLSATSQCKEDLGI